MAHYPQIVANINSQVVHKSYPEPVDGACGQTGGEPVENQGMTGGQPGKTLAGIHTHPSPVHTERTPPVHKKWAANWENTVLPRIHSPYYYYVLITQ